MDIRRTPYIILLVILLITGAIFVLKKNMRNLDPADFNIPTGWYMHEMNSGNLLLTRQKELPDIGATEGLAYGEQIAISSIKLDQPIDSWIAQRIPDDDSLYISKERGTLNGHQTLKVEHEAEAAGKILDYYIFSADHAYVFSLYPLETIGSGKTIRNTADIKILEQLVKEYASKI